VAFPQVSITNVLLTQTVKCTLHYVVLPILHLRSWDNIRLCVFVRNIICIEHFLKVWMLRPSERGTLVKKNIHV